MQKKEELIQNFKTAIASTTKSVSNVKDIEVIFGNEKLKTNKKIIKLPDLQNINEKIDYTKARALADSEALKIRYSNEKILKSYEPEGNISKKLYHIAEKIRYEKLGSLEFKGIKNNIDEFYNAKLEKTDFEKNENKYVDAFENYLRSNIFNYKNNKNYKSFKKEFDEKLKKSLKPLNDLVKNQLKFNSMISELISEMKIEEDANDEQKKESKNEQDTRSSQTEDNDRITQENQDQNNEMAIETSAEVMEDLAEEDDQDSDILEIEKFFDSQNQKIILKDIISKYGLYPCLFGHQAEWYSWIIYFFGVVIWLFTILITSTGISRILLKQLKGDDFYSGKDAWEFIYKHWQSVNIRKIYLQSLNTFCDKCFVYFFFGYT